MYNSLTNPKGQLIKYLIELFLSTEPLTTLFFTGNDKNIIPLTFWIFG